MNEQLRQAEDAARISALETEVKRLTALLEAVPLLHINRYIEYQEWYSQLMLYPIIRGWLDAWSIGRDARPEMSADCDE